MRFCVIGLGRFGYQIATRLAENGKEVVAIDRDENIIASIRDHVTHAICMHAIDENALLNVGVEEMDVVIVAMGENFAESIVITTLLKTKLKIPNVITRATNDIHHDILKLVGADHVILPEREVAIRLADTLSAS
jgi:trk system potassium uptake protein TrkA